MPHTALPPYSLVSIIGVVTLSLQLWLGNLRCRGGDGIGCIVLIIPYAVAYILPALSYGMLSQYALGARYKYAFLHQTFFILLMLVIQRPSFDELYAYFIWGYASLIFLVVFDALSQASVKLYRYARYRTTIKNNPDAESGLFFILLV